tara:strand:+ start:1470 stop:2015 length:546 start_codon:yes stop_codon:yes gene_type:complete
MTQPFRHLVCPALCAVCLGLIAILTMGTKVQGAPDAVNKVMQTALPPELTAMFPVGREFKGVAIPSYTDEELKSVMRAATMIRVDERFLDLTDLVVLIYNSSGEPETTISMDEAAYDLNTGQLRSKTPSKIEQARFTMTGDIMTFDSQTHLSRLEGNVRVVVLDAGNFGASFGIPTSNRSE